MKENTPPKEIYRVASGLAKTFIQRWDIYAQQQEDGRYFCYHKPLRLEDLTRHLRGEITLGTYVLDRDNQARYIVLDADDEAGLEALRRLALNLPCYLETSRRGGHLWAFFEIPIPGSLAKGFGNGLLQNIGIEMEVFPKQAESDGPGSLVRLPFGIHRKSGERYPFIRPDGNYLGNWMAQMEALMNPKTVDLSLVERIGLLGEPLEKEKIETSTHIWDQIKAKITVLDFVDRYIDLRETGNGAVGKCPFHDDRHPSFSVNKDQNYWYCFAGCGGGSIIDFWMKWSNCDFSTATDELAEMLGVEDGEDIYRSRNS